MDITLVVVRPFGPHAIGDRISTPEVVAATIASDHKNSVVAVPAAQSATPAGKEP